MITRIVTNEEIRKLLKMGSASNPLIDMWNDMATEMLCSLIGVTDLAVHQVTDERVEQIFNGKFYLNDFPVNPATLNLKDTFSGSAISPYSYKLDAGNIRTVRVYDANGVMPGLLPYSKAFATYQAGYTIQDVLTVLVNPTNGQTINFKAAGTTTTYTFRNSSPTANDIQIGGDVNATAANIAAKLGGVANSAVVTLPLGLHYEAGGTTPSNSISFVAANLPATFKMVIAFIAGGGIAEANKSGNVVSYTIGGKSVTFRNDAEGSIAQNYIKNWLPQFSSIKIAGV